MIMTVLTPKHWRTLTAVMDRVIPADDFPAASAAGVPAYLERLFALEGPDHHAAALTALDADARATCGADFHALSALQQDELMRRVEHGDVITPWATNPQSWFATLVAQCMEGYYADPGNGGNLHEVSWRMIGFTPR